jgi:hypothetical protein
MLWSATPNNRALALGVLRWLTHMPLLESVRVYVSDGAVVLPLGLDFTTTHDSNGDPPNGSAVRKRHAIFTT